EAFGSTKLVQVGNHFSLLNSSGVGPTLQSGGADLDASVYGNWAPIGAEQLAGGGDLVAWKEEGADLYSVWTTDSSANMLYSLNYVSGADYRLEVDEALMHQDLNGD